MESPALVAWSEAQADPGSAPLLWLRLPQPLPLPTPWGCPLGTSQTSPHITGGAGPQPVRLRGGSGACVFPGGGQV